MTEQTTPETEEWRKVPGPKDKNVWGYVMGPGEDEWIADVPTEAIADAIIQDHKAARIAEEALKANKRLQHLQQFPHLKPDKWEQQALDALASLSREEK